jgi:hypothetical protein
MWKLYIRILTMSYTRERRNMQVEALLRYSRMRTCVSGLILFTRQQLVQTWRRWNVFKQKAIRQLNVGVCSLVTKFKERQGKINSRWPTVKQPCWYSQCVKWNVWKDKGVITYFQHIYFGVKSDVSEGWTRAPFSELRSRLPLHSISQECNLCWTVGTAASVADVERNGEIGTATLRLAFSCEEPSPALGSLISCQNFFECFLSPF